MLSTPRLTLRAWRKSDRDAFAAMHADSDVMLDLGGPFDRSQSDAKFDRYVTAFVQNGICRWAIEGIGGAFVGYAGVMLRPDVSHPLGIHADAGWRLIRSAWGRGYATEAAATALKDAFTRTGLTEIFAYTSPDNPRSQAVMARLGSQRAPDRDFVLAECGWRGLVWIAQPRA
jgi:RimJ/RimL family protein N-acetyltransferase